MVPTKERGEVPGGALVVALFFVVLGAWGGLWLWRGESTARVDLIEGDALQREKDGASGLAKEASAPGSSREAQRASASLDGRTDCPELVMRLYLDSGEPLKTGSVYVSCANTEIEQVVFLQRDFTLNGSHELKVSLPSLPDSCHELDLAVYHVRRRKSVSAETWSYRVKFSGPRSGRTWVAPDLMLEKRESRLVCSGTVVDADGMPLADSQVSVVPEFGPDVSRSEREMSILLSGLNRWLWTDAKGRFEVRRDPEVARTYRLWALAEGYEPAHWERIQEGSANLLIRLHKTAAISGAVRLLSRVHPGWLRITMDPEWEVVGPSRRYAMSLPGRRGGTVDFILRGLPPGTYRFGISYVTSDFPLVRISGIVIRRFEESRDARVQKINLRREVRSIQVEVRGEDGRPYADARMWIRIGKDRKKSPRKLVRTDGFGGLDIPVLRSGAPLTLEARGYKPVRLDKAAGLLTIHLRKR